jgi:hypothetical protein
VENPSFISWTTLGTLFLLVPADIYLISKQEGNGEPVGDAFGDWFLKVFIIIPLALTAAAVPLVLTDIATGAACTLTPKNLDVERPSRSGGSQVFALHEMRNADTLGVHTCGG